MVSTKTVPSVREMLETLDHTLNCDERVIDALHEEMVKALNDNLYWARHNERLIQNNSNDPLGPLSQYVEMKMYMSFHAANVLVRILQRSGIGNRYAKTEWLVEDAMEQVELEGIDRGLHDTYAPFRSYRRKEFR